MRNLLNVFDHVTTFTINEFLVALLIFLCILTFDKKFCGEVINTLEHLSDFEVLTLSDPRTKFV